MSIPMCGVGCEHRGVGLDDVIEEVIVSESGLLGRSDVKRIVR